MSDKIEHKKIEKEEEIKCEKCKKKVQCQISNLITENSNKEKHNVCRGVRCNGCGAFIWAKN